MQQRRELFVFFLGEQRYAIDLACVERVVRACAVTELADAPPAVLGVVVIHGKVLPVYDPRVRFGLPLRPVSPEHQMVVLETSKRSACLLIDSAVGIVNCTPMGHFAADELVAGAPAWLASVQKTNDGVLYVHDLEMFLDTREEARLSASLKAHAQAGGSK